MECFKFDTELSNRGLLKIIDWSPATFKEPYHWHDSLEIGYCKKGHGWFYFGDKVYDVCAGDIFVVNNLQGHIAQSDASNPSYYHFIYFNRNLLELLNPELLLPFISNPIDFNHKIPARTKMAEDIGNLIEEINKEFQEENYAHHAMAYSYLIEICVMLLRHYRGDRSGQEWERERKAYYRLKPGLDFIQDHAQEDISLEDVANHLALSPSRTRHLMKETIGEGFKEYLLRRRVTLAQGLLLNTNLSVLNVGLQSGFQSDSSFYRAFKQMTGMTPQDFRNQS
ncbi:AraC family transcriptional regulator [Alicyclobacillus fastidiosus]|uniref:AraC family transcriptional regulator n=1 Tax=Alicyclobacillus fastidiosus TaxID=392011 RepID=A0ABV5AL36_9BACL|nr:AraC family transcriptional regulator [Alicyclobacillus fastidiosus]WEH08305.1 AraC family transcriptional regulator [Alicyclobacillus fastidiosus]